MIYTVSVFITNQVLKFFKKMFIYRNFKTNQQWFNQMYFLPSTKKKILKRKCTHKIWDIKLEVLLCNN